jgi:hypothetical protein
VVQIAQLSLQAVGVAQAVTPVMVGKAVFSSVAEELPVLVAQAGVARASCLPAQAVAV